MHDTRSQRVVSIGKEGESNEVLVVFYFLTHLCSLCVNLFMW